MPALVDSYVGEAERLSRARAADAAWLTRLRRDGLGRFESLGFPTTREEDWRFTSVAPIADARFALARDGAASLRPGEIAALGWHGEVAATLVFVNGRYVDAASDTRRLPRGVTVRSLGAALADPTSALEGRLATVAAFDRRPFPALNTAFLADGGLIDLPASAVLEAPIHLVFLSTREEPPAMAHPRVLITMGPNSQASIVESYGAAGGGRYFTNAVTEIIAGDNATLEHYRIQRESDASYHVGGTYVRAGRDAHVTCHSVALGGALVRNDVIIVLDGEGGGCALNGLYLSDGARFVDNHTTIDHAKAHCGSREIYKGILADRSRAVFNGRIIVRPDAQKTDAKQTNKALLLSEEAQINTKPELEIFANDVKCTHGAAVGQRDDEAIFYLRARGLALRDARQLLVRAFAGDVLKQMQLQALRERIDQDLVARLPEWRG